MLIGRTGERRLYMTVTAESEQGGLWWSGPEEVRESSQEDSVITLP
jgi:hypothetical protein